MMNWPPERKNTLDLGGHTVCERPQSEGFGPAKAMLTASKDHEAIVAATLPHVAFITIDYNSNMLQQFDPRNKDIQVWVARPVYRWPRSLYSTVRYRAAMLFEGMRVYKHGVYCLDRHLDRLEDSALAMAFRRCAVARVH